MQENKRIIDGQRGFGLIVLIAIMGIVFSMLFYWGSRGWGYMGYRGYHHGPSWWYMGGPRYHYGGSMRHGSTGGRSHRGGGFRGGK